MYFYQFKKKTIDSLLCFDLKMENHWHLTIVMIQKMYKLIPAQKMLFLMQFYDSVEYLFF